jgi:hypothetical protein
VLSQVKMFAQLSKSDCIDKHILLKIFRKI